MFYVQSIYSYQLLVSYLVMKEPCNGNKYILLSCAIQWCSEGNWRLGANLNFAPPPFKKNPKNDTEMSSIQLIMCIIISAYPTCIFYDF